MSRLIKDKVILGIDPGTNLMGYGVLHIVDSKPKVVTLGVIDLRKYANHYLKLAHIHERVSGIIQSYLPDELAIEAPFFGKNVQSMLKLGRAQGVAIAAAISRDLSITEYEPSVIKQHITGNGNATKQQVATILASILNGDSRNTPFEIQNPQYYDATDALAVAYTCHLHLSNPIADIQQQLAPAKSKRHKSSKKQWSEFVLNNPDIIN